MKYKLYLWVFFATLQGSVQAGGSLFSGMKDKVFGWFGKEKKDENSIIQGPVKKLTQEELIKILLKDAGENEEMKERLCNKYSDTVVCKEREETNTKLIKTFKVQKQSLEGEKLDKFQIIEKKATPLTQSELPTGELCKQKPEIQGMLNELFPGRGLSCEKYVKALKVKLAKETVEKKYN